MEKKYAIIHDTLAKEIAAKASVKTRRIRQMKAVLKQYIERDKLLDRSDLRITKQIAKDIDFTDTETILIKKSKQRLILKTILFTTIALIIFSAVAFATWSYWQANQAKKRAESRRLAYVAQQELAQKKVTTALQLAQLAYQFDSSPIASKVLSDAFHQTHRGIPWHTHQIQLPEKVQKVSFYSDTSLVYLSDNQAIKIVDFAGDALDTFDGFPVIKNFERGNNKLFLWNAAQIWIRDYAKDTTNDFQVPNSSKIEKIFVDKETDAFVVLTVQKELFYYKSVAKKPKAFPKVLSEYIEITSTLFQEGQFLFWVKKTGTFPLSVELVKWDIRKDSLNNLDYFPQGILDAHLIQKNKLVDAFSGQLHTAKEPSVALEQGINLLKVIPTQTSFLTGNQDNAVKLWRQNGEHLAFLKQYPSKVKSLDISPNNHQYLAGTEKGTITIWSIKHPVLPAFKASKKVLHVDYDKKEQLLLTLVDSSVQLVQLDGKQIQEFREHRGLIRGSIFLNDSKILTYGEDQSAIIWNKNGKQVKRIQEHQEEINYATAHIPTQQIATGSKDGVVKIWDFEGNNLKTLEHPDYVQQVVFSKDGQTVLTACRDNIGRIWKKDTILLEGHHHKRDFSIRQIDFSKDEQNVLTASGDGQCIQWDLDGNILQKFSNHGDWVNALTLSNNGNLVLLGSEDRTASLWQLDGTLITKIVGHSDAIRGVLFTSRESSFPLTYSDDHAAKLWNRNGEILANYPTSSPIIATYQLPNNNILTISRNGEIQHWYLPDKIGTYFQNHPLPALSEEEKTQFGIH